MWIDKVKLVMYNVGITNFIGSWLSTAEGPPLSSASLKKEDMLARVFLATTNDVPGECRVSSVSCRVCTSCMMRRLTASMRRNLGVRYWIFTPCG